MKNMTKHAFVWQVCSLLYAICTQIIQYATSINEPHDIGEKRTDLNPLNHTAYCNTKNIDLIPMWAEFDYNKYVTITFLHYTHACF